MIDVEKYVEIKSKGVDMVNTAVAGREPIVTTLNVVPSTEAQTITAPEGVDGFNPVNVGAVTASIDPNIQASNIKQGVSILGVEGSAVELDGETLSVTPTTSSQEFTPTSPHNAYTSVSVNAVTSSIDSNIKANNIKNGVEILGVTGNVTELNGETLSISPTTSQQSFSPVAPHNGYTNVTVDAVTSAIDANITAGNIKQGVSILGVEGTVKPAPDICIPRRKYLQSGEVYLGSAEDASALDLEGVVSIGTENVLSYALASSSGTSFSFKTVKNIIGNTACSYMFLRSSITSVSFPNLELVGWSALQGAFSNCSRLTNISFGKKVNFTGSAAQAFSNTFKSCTALTSVDLSNFESLPSQNCCNSMFDGCSSLVSVNLSGLKTISGSQALYWFLRSCPLATDVNLSSLVSVTNSYVFRSFGGAITSLSFDSLTEITGDSVFYTSFGFDTQTPIHIYFPSITTNSFGSSYRNQFSNFWSSYNNYNGYMHFPKNLDPQTGDTTISSLIGYPNFNKSNTVLLFDLPSTLTLTGADNNIYTRNPKYDTGLFLAWKRNAYGSTELTPVYYTEGRASTEDPWQDPQVGATIYSDPTNLIPETTIASIS